MEIPQGRLFVGRYGGVEQVSKKDGTPVQGMFEITVVQDLADREWTHKAVFFATDQDGEVSKMQKSSEASKPYAGQLIAVRISTRGSLSGGKAYANDTAIGVHVLEPAKAPVATPVRA
jgi:hypothetical protein